MKGVAALIVVIAVAAAVVGGYFVATSQGWIQPLSPTDGPSDTSFNAATDCDDDGLTRLVAAYEDGLADESTSVAVDSEVYQKVGGAWKLVSTTDDETSATFGTYNEVGTNLLICGETYKVYLGDEVEEYFRASEEFVAKGAEKRVTVTGVVIGGETWTGLDTGTVEATTNITVGSGGTSNALKLQYSSSTANAGHEAPNGMIFAVSYNDTAFQKVEPTGVTTFSGDVKTNGQPIKAVSCPDVVGRSVLTTANIDTVRKCWVLPVTHVADGGSFEIPIYIAAEAGVDPSITTAACDGSLITGCGLAFGMLDQNMFQDVEDASHNAPMKLGYEGDDEDNIGEATATTKSVFLN